MAKKIELVEKFTEVIYGNKFTREELYEQLKFFYQSTRRVANKARLFKKKPSDFIEDENGELPL